MSILRRSRAPVNPDREPHDDETPAPSAEDLAWEAAQHPRGGCLTHDLSPDEAAAMSDFEHWTNFLDPDEDDLPDEPEPDLPYCLF